MMPLTHIVVAIDLDEHSLPTLTMGIDLAEVHKARVTLVHVLEPTPTPPGLEAFALEGMPIDWVERVTAARRGVAERKLAELARDHSRLAVPVTQVLLSGLLPETLNEFLKRESADLLVVASHGRKGVAHFFLGSVAERLMRTAPCPVLVVKPQAPAAT